MPEGLAEPFDIEQTAVGALANDLRTANGRPLTLCSVQVELFKLAGQSDCANCPEAVLRNVRLFNFVS
jgi:hypothetical protein